MNYDIEIKRIVTKHIIYPNEHTNISKYHVVYGNKIKATQCSLSQKYMSLYGIQSLIYDVTNNKILTSKGFFCMEQRNIY